MAVAVEVLFHGRVTRRLQDPVRSAERINAVTGENEAGLAKRLVQDREIAASGGDAVAEIFRWSCAEFNLAAWLHGQEAGSGQRSRYLEML